MSTPVNLPSNSSVPIPQPQSSSDVNALASQIKSMVDSASAGAVQLSQATVVATALTATPPTVSVTMSGSTVQIDGVSFFEGYTPAVNDNVDVLKQGNAIVVIGHVADTGTPTAASGGWITPSLLSGFSQGGNSNANLQYRLILDNGSWKMQWRGAVGHTGTNNSIVSALSSTYRPANKVSVIASRSISQGIIDVGIDFQTDGTINLVGANTADAGQTGLTNSNTGYANLVTDIKLSGYLSQAGSDLGHGHVVDSHTHDIPASSPSWIGFHGIEYFL